MNCVRLHILALIFPVCLPAQVRVLAGANVHVNFGTRVQISQNLTVEAGSLLQEGQLFCSGNVHISPGGLARGNGTYSLKGNWINQGIFLAGTSTVRFSGVQDAAVEAGGAPFYQLSLDKSHARLSLSQDLTISRKLSFSGNFCHIVLHQYNLTVSDTAALEGFDEDEFIVTNASGTLVRRGLNVASFVFPVGPDSSIFCPLTLSENGSTDDISVRAQAQVLENGFTGAALSAGLVSQSWVVKEQSPGGSVLSAEAQWNAAQEQSGFDRSNCGIARYNSGTDWDLPPTALGIATGANPYSRKRLGLSPGVLCVSGTLFMNRVLVSPKVFLQGCFNGSTNLMNDLLRSLNLIPLNPPTTYTFGKFSPAGWQASSYTITDPNILNLSGPDAVVDWVFLWLKDPAMPTQNLQTRVALLQRDGDVVDLDGTSAVAVPGNAGNYILGIGHRNHLSVRSPNGVGINFNENTPTVYDFSTAMSQAYGVNPMKQLQTSPPIFGLWGGNSQGDDRVRASGPAVINDYSFLLTSLGLPSNVLSNVYHNADLNMDGTVRVSGPASINDYSKLLNVLGSPSTIIIEQ